MGKRSRSSGASSYSSSDRFGSTAFSNISNNDSRSGSGSSRSSRSSNGRKSKQPLQGPLESGSIRNSFVQFYADNHILSYTRKLQIPLGLPNKKIENPLTVVQQQGDKHGPG